MILAHVEHVHVVYDLCNVKFPNPKFVNLFSVFNRNCRVLTFLPFVYTKSRHLGLVERSQIVLVARFQCI